MLPSRHRMRESVEFAAAVRTGRRAGRGTVVVHLRRPESEPSESRNRPTRIGFVVSKRVGNAVVRNRTRRRLRHAMREHLSDLGDGMLIVVRALPAAASAGSARLSRDLSAALAAARPTRGTARAGPAPEEAAR